MIVPILFAALFVAIAVILIWNYKSRKRTSEDNNNGGASNESEEIKDIKRE